MNKRSLIGLFIIWILVVLSFTTTQLTNDFKPFWAYGRFVSNSDASGIGALIDTWEMKGLLFKTYLYVEYELTSKFSTLFDEYGQIVYKFFGLIPFLGVLYLSIIIIPKQFLHGIRRIEVYFITSILLLSVHFASHFQAEMWGVLLLILSISIYLHKGPRAKVLAAIIFSLTFFLKSPIPLLGGSIVLASMLLKKQTVKEGIKDVIPFAISSFLFLFFSLSFVYLYYPQEVNEIWNASYYQHTLFHDSGKILISVKNFISGFLKTSLYNPINFIGFIISFVLMRYWYGERSLMKIAMLIMMWLFPIIYIFISNCFFVYHYYLLSFPSILTILVYLGNNSIWLSKNRIKILVTSLSLYYVLILSSVSYINLYEKKTYANYSRRNMIENELYVGCKLGNDSVLFLDDGTGAFYFSNKSYLRYFYPLPLQRISKKDPFAKMPTYIDTKKKALSYNGEYLILKKTWFLSFGNNDDIYNKIIAEYNLKNVILTPRYSWKLYKKDEIDTLLVYKRK